MQVPFLAVCSLFDCSLVVLTSVSVLSVNPTLVACLMQSFFFATVVPLVGIRVSLFVAAALRSYFGDCLVARPVTIFGVRLVARLVADPRAYLGIRFSARLPTYLAARPRALLLVTAARLRACLGAPGADWCAWLV